SVTELKEVLNRLTRAAGQGNEAAARATIHVLWRALRPNAPEPAPNGSLEPWLAALLEPALRTALPAIGHETYAWIQVLEVLGRIDREAAIRLAAQALVQYTNILPEQAEDLLRGFAVQQPQLVMRLLGEALLNPAFGWRLAVGPIRRILSFLPIEVVKQWL